MPDMDGMDGMDDTLRGLNAAQKTAVVCGAAVVQVLAPPGSGKTKTLTARVAHLVSRRGLQPCDIVVCTFTVKAAREMRERIAGLVGAELSRRLKLGTFHSVALRYLKTYGHHIGLPAHFGIADTSDQKAILKRIVKRFGMAMQPGQALGRISSRKAKGESAVSATVKKSVDQHEFDRIYDAYQATLAASNLLDYDDILLECCRLLQSHPQCVSNVQAVLIDEFQDTNNVQYRLMSLFAQRRNVITIVGDPDQSIYGFRSAEIGNLGRMKTQWPDTLTINLEENYRSSGAILHAAQNIIEQDESRPPKKLQATHGIGLRPVLRKLPSAMAEAQWLVSEIKRMQSLSGDMLSASDFAVLLRSAALSRAVETALGNAGISYRMVGGTRFYDRVEVKLVVDYLQVIHAPDNSEAVERIVNVPSRKVGEHTIKELRAEAHSRGLSLWELILDIAQGRHQAKTKLSDPNRKGLSAFVDVILSGRKRVESWREQTPSVVDLINLVSHKIRLESYLKTKFADELTYEARWSNVEELMAQAAELTRPAMLQELADMHALPVVEGVEQRPGADEDVLSTFLANIALTASAEKAADEGGEKVPQVTISTIHAAKGLEWPVVFVPACYDGSIPHSRAEDHDEERRLLYVGMTRAQAVLYLSCPIKDTQKQETVLSKFLVHKGMSRYFDQHGPSLPIADVPALSTTLGRACPTNAKLAELRAALDQDEDNYWPLNGEEPPGQQSHLNHAQSSTSFKGFVSSRTVCTTTTHQNYFTTSTATATMPVQQGFVSVANRYEELMEQASLRHVNLPAGEHAKISQQKLEPQTKGRKRPIDGPGSIASFFKKPRLSPEPDPEPPPTPLPQTRPALQPSSQNIQPQTRAPTTERCMPVTRHPPPSHKPQSTPSTRKPTRSRTSSARADGENVPSSKYVFLSSSPLPPPPPSPDPDDEPAPRDGPPPRPPSPPRRVDASAVGPAARGFRPASTFHTTSMQTHAQQGTRKTLGVRRSLHGWPPPSRRT